MRQFEALAQFPPALRLEVLVKILVERRIPVIGTLGVLKEAATLGLLDLRVSVERL